MFGPFVRLSRLTPEQLRHRARVIEARLRDWSVEELLRGRRDGEPSDVDAGGPRRSGYDPNQPRVPAGHPDGGQWTDDEWGADHPLIGARFAASELPPIGPLGRIRLILQRALRIIEALRSDNMLYDLFGRPRGTVSMLEIDGRIFFGSNSRLPLYTSRDQAEANNLRDVLLRKYARFGRSNSGQTPMDALYHAETNVLLRAAGEFGGTLAGRTLEVVVDRPMCSSCLDILPYVGLELGNPTVTFISPRGQVRTMRDGRWID